MLKAVWDVARVGSSKMQHHAPACDFRCYRSNSFVIHSAMSSEEEDSLLDGLELDDLAGLAAELEALREELGEEYVQASVSGSRPAIEQAGTRD